MHYDGTVPYMLCHACSFPEWSITWVSILRFFTLKKDFVLWNAILNATIEMKWLECPPCPPLTSMYICLLVVEWQEVLCSSICSYLCSYILPLPFSYAIKCSHAEVSACTLITYFYREIAYLIICSLCWAICVSLLPFGMWQPDPDIHMHL